MVVKRWTGGITLDSISVRFITAREYQHRSTLLMSRHTILDLPHPGLEVVKGQVADLSLQALEIHSVGDTPE